jgi:hypothetical protein
MMASDEGACQETWVGRIVKDVIDGEKLRHGADLGQVQPR